MKKFSIVSLVLLFTSIAAYGTNYWYADNPNCIRTISGYSYVGIGGSASGYRLNVCGTLRTVNFKMSNGAVKDYVLTCNGSGGAAVWKPISGGGSCLWDEGSGDNIYYNDGNVGIGTSNPLAKFTIYNPNPYDTNESFNDQDHILLWSDYANLEAGDLFGGLTWYSGGRRRAGIAAIREETDADIIGIAFLTKGTNGPGCFHESMRIAHNGNVGIGTKNPAEKLHVIGNSIISGSVGIGTDDPGSYKLAVNGHIKTKAITVESNWPDFVFEDNYQLMPIEKLEKHIKIEKSLPGIPTEKEVKENGVEVGEMQAKLLEKVEELTLYVIELKKENVELKNRIKALEN